MKVYNEKEDVLKYKLGLHELHPSIDWRTKHFIMNILELKGENSWPVFSVYGYCWSCSVVAATCQKRGIEVHLDIHIVFIHPEIYLSSTRLTTVPDCQV